MVTTCFAHATRRHAAKCCGYFAILEGHQATAGPGQEMNEEGFTPPPPFWPQGGVGGHKWRPYDMRPHEDPLDAATRPLVAPPFAGRRLAPPPARRLTISLSSLEIIVE